MLNIYIYYQALSDPYMKNAASIQHRHQLQVYNNNQLLNTRT